MKIKTPGRLKSAADFQSHWGSVAPDLGFDAEVRGAAGPLGQPLRLGTRTIGNRFATQPMEGWDATPEGLPSADTQRRWERFGRGGAKLIWGGEAVAVSPAGRANPNQLHVSPRVDSGAGLRALRLALVQAHAEVGLSTDDLCVGLQLTHSGRYARPSSSGPEPRIACRHPLLDARLGITSDDAVITDAELDDLTGDYVRAAQLAQVAGYDFVDVKCCHGYLLHELLGAKTRSGAYGGSFENRTRFFVQTVSAIRAECPGLEVGVRVSIADVLPFAPGSAGQGQPEPWAADEPYTYGFGACETDPSRIDLAESLRFLQLVSRLGIRLVNLTLGSPYYNPHLQRPAAYPPCDGYQPPEDPLFQVAEHLRVTRRCQAAVPELYLVGSGYTYLQEWLPGVAQHEVGGGHVAFVGLGRMALSYPELPRDVLAGSSLARKKICRTFSDCTTAPRNGLPSGCYPLDAHYKRRPAAQALRVIKERSS